MLQGAGQEATAEESSRINAYRRAAADHTVQSNRLINVARRIKANSRIRGDPQKIKRNHFLNATTMEAYRMHSEKCQRSLSNLSPTTEGTIGGAARERAEADDPYDSCKTDQEARQHLQEKCEMYEQVQDIKVDNESGLILDILGACSGYLT